MTIELKTLQIKKIPELSDMKTWTKFSDKLNELTNQGYQVFCATETYIIMSRKTDEVRREE